MTDITCGTTAYRTGPAAIQMIVENVDVRLAGRRRLVSEC